MSNRIVVAGGSGFIGRLLTDRLVSGNNDVVVLTRSPGPAAQSIRQVRWDGRTLGDWARELEDARALINLAGRSVNCRYNERNRREILESRVDSTRVLGEAITRCNTPPAVWLNASTATIYKHSFDQQMDEAAGIIAPTPEAKDAFSIEVARAWEERSSRRLPLQHGRSHCARRWYSPQARVAFTGSCEGSRDGDWEARPGRFQRAGKPGLAEPDSATRYDENHTSGAWRTLWIARDSQDA